MKSYELSNDRCHVEIQPRRGGKILDFIDKTKKKNWVWRQGDSTSGANPLPLGVNFDDHFFGGWEEIFPSDTAGRCQGRNLVDHGELWSQEWEVVEHSRSGLEMSYSCKTVPIMVNKTLTLDPNRPLLNIKYVFKNLSEDEIPYHFKLHPALTIEPGDEILLPSSTIEPVTLDFSTLIGRSEKTRFPMAIDRSGNPIELNQVRSPDSNKQEFIYASQLSEGWCGLSNKRTRTKLLIHFNHQQMPYVWCFMSYGRWRNTYLIMLEPCTNIPYDLETAVRNKTSAILKAHAIDQYWVTYEIAES